MLPRLLLHWLQAGTRFVRSWLPPLSNSIRWSAVVAGLPHHAQGGLSASSCLRLRWYSGFAYGLVIGPDARYRACPSAARCALLSLLCAGVICRVWCCGFVLVFVFVVFVCWLS